MLKIGLNAETPLKEGMKAEKCPRGCRYTNTFTFKYCGHLKVGDYEEDYNSYIVDLMQPHVQCSGANLT